MSFTLVEQNAQGDGPATGASRARHAGHVRLAAILALAVGVLAGLPERSRAQEPSRQGAQQPRPRTQADRGAMVRELHERLAATVKRELQLTDAQAEKLAATNVRIDERRRPLLQRERGLRTQLRRELQRRDSADQREVGTLLDGLIAVQRQRLELLEVEQRELSQFLTPVQRARFYSLQENWRRHVEEEAERDRGAYPGNRGEKGAERGRPPAGTGRGRP